MSSLSKVLSFLIEERRLSTAELARKTGVAQPIVYRLMSGSTENPQIMTLKPIADYFNVSVDQLMGFKPLDEPRPLNRETVHAIHAKLASIKTVASALMDIVPTLRKGYEVACEARLMQADMPTEMLPILELNIINLVKAADTVASLLIRQKSEKKE